MKVLIFLIFWGTIFSCSEMTSSNNKKDDSQVIQDSSNLNSYTIDTLALYSEFFSEDWMKVDDILLTEDYFYVLRLGPAAIFQVDWKVPRDMMLSSQELIYDFTGGGIIEKKDSLYFIGNRGWNVIYKYHPDLGQYYLMQDLDKITLTPANNLQTMYTAFTISENFIFAVLAKDDYDTSASSLNKYDFDGNLLESYPYNKNTYWITIYDDVVFGNSCLLCEDSLFALTRYDLSTKTFMSDITHPAEFGYGTCIFDGKFFFTDTRNLFIGSVPLDEVLR